jgi:RNA polymerase sigma factor (sigma-70 family)
MPATDSTTAIEAVYRLEFPRVVAVLAAFTSDIALAEELAQDALVDALRQWPRDGIPHNPGAWLTTVGKRKAIDTFRRQGTLAAKYAEIGRELEAHSALDGDEAVFGAMPSEEIDDDRVRLIFVACHPVLAMPARAALTLRLIGGLSVPEIARAYVVPEATIAQRIVRAKKTIARAGVPFEVPVGDDRLSRLAAVLEVIYLIFNEGYSATAGDDLLRPALCEDALRLARVLEGLMPKEPEVHGLAALLEFQASRMAARTGPDGEPVLLADQNRARWNQMFIRRGIEALERAGDGPYSVQAAIAACHARAVTFADTDWTTISALYDQLMVLTPSPVVELNRAVAVSRAEGPAAGLTLVDALADDPALQGYHLLPSVRGDLLERLGRPEEASAAFTAAAALTRNERERELLLDRAARAGSAASRAAAQAPS